MQKEKCLLGLEENEKGRHAELDSASHLVAVLESGEIPYQVRDDKFIFNGTKAVTLIELLVVVLIIGILAAVALPQYKVAVAKARMAQLITLANAVAQAEERYYLANGQYTTDWEELDIGLEGTVSGNATNSSKLINSAGWQITLCSHIEGVTTNEVNAKDNRISGVALVFVFNNSPRADLRGKRYCNAVTSNTMANILCKNATNKTSPEGYPTGAYRYFF